MGRNIYLTDKEISQLIYACNTYIKWSWEDDFFCKEVENDLKNGLGSALRKICKDTYYENDYKDYK